MTQNVIVQAAYQYRIANDKTGEIENEGVTVRYISTENMAPYEDSAKSVKGYKPAKASLPYEDYAKFHTVPALYEATFGVNVATDGKTTLALKDCKFLSGIVVSKSTGNRINLTGKET